MHVKYGKIFRGALPPGPIGYFSGKKFRRLGFQNKGVRGGYLILAIWVRASNGIVVIRNCILQIQQGAYTQNLDFSWYSHFTCFKILSREFFDSFYFVLQKDAKNSAACQFDTSFMIREILIEKQDSIFDTSFFI